MSDYRRDKRSGALIATDKVAYRRVLAQQESAKKVKTLESQVEDLTAIVEKMMEMK